MKKITLLFTVATLATTFSFAQSSGKITLVKGQKLIVENKINSVSSQEIMGNSMEVTADVTSNSSIEVKDQKDKNYTLSNTVTRLNVAMSMMGQQMNYDSDKQEDRDGDMGKELNKMINTPINIEMSDNGKVIPNAEAKTDKPADPSQAAMGAMLGNAGDPKAFAEMAFLVVPSGMKAGSSWVDSSVNEAGKKVTTYTIREIKGTEAMIDIKGTVQTSTKQEMMGNEVTSNTSGTIAGESIVDLSNGMVKNHAVTINTTGSAEIMGQQIPITTKVTSKTTIVPGK